MMNQSSDTLVDQKIDGRSAAHSNDPWPPEEISSFRYALISSKLS